MFPCCPNLTTNYKILFSIRKLSSECLPDDVPGGLDIMLVLKTKAFELQLEITWKYLLVYISPVFAVICESTAFMQMCCIVLSLEKEQALFKKC